MIRENPSPTKLSECQRILIVGCSGSGKSWLGKRLAEELNLPLIHLDREFWQPGWVQTEHNLWRKKLLQLLSGRSWVMEGNYTGTLALRLEYCEALIHADMPRWLCMLRILKRPLLSPFRKRPDRPPGCPERWDAEFTRWVWNFHQSVRPDVLRIYDSTPESIVRHHLKTTTEMNNLLKHLHHGYGPIMQGRSIPLKETP